MLEAPKKPATPVVCSRMYWASSGSAMGPPWQRTMMSGLTAAAASRIAWTQLGGGLQREGRGGADRALGGQAHVGHDDVGAGLGHGPGLVGSKT